MTDEKMLNDINDYSKKQKVEYTFALLNSLINWILSPSKIRSNIGNWYMVGGQKIDLPELRNVAVEMAADSLYEMTLNIETILAPYYDPEYYHERQIVDSKEEMGNYFKEDGESFKNVRCQNNYSRSIMKIICRLLDRLNMLLTKKGKLIIGFKKEDGKGNN